LITSRSGRRADAGHVVVFGDPVAAIAVLFDMAGELAGFFDRVGVGLAFADHDQVQYGQGCHGVS
jgi:hypothetical protein